MKSYRDFKGIWIPKEIWENQDLSLQEKVFYVEIDSLNNEDGCYASNDYFAKFFSVTSRQVQRVIASLIDKNLVVSEVNQGDGNVRTLRTIGHEVTTKMSLPSRQKSRPPHDENVVHNNTVNNTLNNTEREETPAQRAREFFTNQQKQAEVISFLVEKGLPENTVKTEVGKFISYWTELTKSGKKQRWELQETFEINKRFSTWFRNFDKFNQGFKHAVGAIQI